MRLLLIFLPILLMAKYYSIQLYTSYSISYAKKFLNNLPLKIKKRSFLYITNSKKYTVRYMIKNKIYKLKPFAKNFKNFSFVEDDYRKIKKLLVKKEKSKPVKTKLSFYTNKTTTVIENNESLQKTNEINTTFIKKFQENNLTLTNNSTIVKNHKNINSTYKISNELQMELALYEYNKDKIAFLLHKKDITPYQKIEANYKLKRFKQVEEEIFSSPILNSQMYATYFEILKNSANFVSFDLEMQEEFLIADTKFKYNPYTIKLKTINNSSKEILISRDFLNYIFSLGYQNSDNSSPVVKFAKNGKIFSYYIVYHQNLLNVDKTAKKIYTIKQDAVGIKLKKTYQYNIIQFNTEFSKNYYKTITYIQKAFEIYNEHIINNTLRALFYIDNVDFSRTFSKHYTEFGIGLNYKEKEDYSKKIKFFLKPIIYYNTQTKSGYKIEIGFNKRIIKADNLLFLISIGPNENGLKMTYTYYF